MVKGGERRERKGNASSASELLEMSVGYKILKQEEDSGLGR